MKRQKQLSRVLSLVLTLSMILGMLPTAAFAVDPSENFDIIQYKGMGMARTTGGASWISRYEYAERENTLHNQFVNFNDNNTLVKLWYTIEKSQPVSLALYKLDKETPLIPQAVDEENSFLSIDMPYFFDIELEDLGASELEDFLDKSTGLIGYLKAFQITENVDNTNPSAMHINSVPITDERWEELVSIAADDMHSKNNSNWISTKEVYAFGFSGEKLVIPPAETTALAKTNLLKEEFGVSEAPTEVEEPVEAEEPAEVEEPAENEEPAEAEEPVETEEPAEAEIGRASCRERV